MCVRMCKGVKDVLEDVCMGIQDACEDAQGSRECA